MYIKNFIFTAINYLPNLKNFEDYKIPKKNSRNNQVKK